MHKLICCYKEKACDKCVIHADRKFCFIEATQTLYLLLQGYFANTESSDKLFTLRDFVNLFVDIIVNTAYNGVETQVIKCPG